MIRLELRNEKGKKEVYEQDFISGRKVREILEIFDQFESDEDLKQAEALDKKVEFVASVFDDKDVTKDAVYEGIESWRLRDELDRVMNEVAGNKKKPEADEG